MTSREARTRGHRWGCMCVCVAAHVARCKAPSLATGPAASQPENRARGRRIASSKTNAPPRPAPFCQGPPQQKAGAAAAARRARPRGRLRRRGRGGRREPGPRKGRASAAAAAGGRGGAAPVIVPAPLEPPARHSPKPNANGTATQRAQRAAAPCTVAHVLLPAPLEPLLSQTKCKMGRQRRARSGLLHLVLQSTCACAFASPASAQMGRQRTAGCTVCFSVCWP